MKQLDLEGAQLDELGGDVHRGIDLGDRAGQVVTGGPLEAEAVAVEPQGPFKVGDTESGVRRLVDVVDVLHGDPPWRGSLPTADPTGGTIPRPPRFNYLHSQL